MLTDFTKLPVNWIDGMKISRRHFEETDQHVTEQLRDVTASRLSDFDFGILHADDSLDMKVFCDVNGQISIDLGSCKAITPNGTRIQILSNGPLHHQGNFKEVAGRFGLQTTQPQQLFIVLSADIFSRVPHGDVVVQETPPRHPYLRDGLKIDLIPAEYLNTSQLGSGLVLGKISYVNGELVHQKDFIPACTTMYSTAASKEWFNRFRQLTDTWEQCCVRIIQKVNSKAQQPNALSNSILKLSEKLLERLASGKFRYLWILPQESPVYTCEYLLSEIYYLFALVQCYNEKDREEMLSYFAEWGELQSGTIENQTIRALQVQYNHYDLQLVFQEILQVYHLYTGIFQKLSQLDFIGKRKGQSVFVIEQEVRETKAPPPPPPQEKQPSRWSPLT